jgi:hypothetical protein
MGSNSAGQGAFLTNHPEVQEINRMLSVGNTPEEVSNWLKEKHKNKRYWASPASIQNYRKNVLNLNKSELAQRRAQLQAEGKTQSANGIALHQTTTELIETKQQAKTEIQMMLDNMKGLQDILVERMNLARSGAVDDMGQPVFKRNNDEMIERYLARYESMINSFIKNSKDMVAPEQSQTNITITTAEIQKYVEAIKGVIQRMVSKFDANLLPEVFQDLNQELARLDSQAGQGQVQISVAGSNNQINIVTGAQAMSSLPSPEEVSEMSAQMTNENDYIQDESAINTIIETRIDN